MKRIVIPLCILTFLPFPAFSQDDNCGLDARWDLAPNQLQSFQIETSGYSNDQLGANAQGLCGVEIGFSHNAVKDLEIFLESPSGQKVQLIGPNVDGSSASLGANWQVTFIPTTDQAEPHPGGYAARWTNDQNLSFAISGGGTYYPFGGDLEEFDTGPVNGTWTVEVKTDPTAINLFPVGIIYHFRLIFCDESGNPCCFAEAGTLRGDDLVACMADLSLDIDPPDVRYIFAVRPDEADYDYRYLIVKDGQIIGVTDDPDLTGEPAGTYEIYGLSFNRADQAVVDDLSSGGLLLSDLRNDLESDAPSFCGDLSDEGPVTVQITAPELTIADPGTLTCDRTEVTLNAGASTPMDALDFEWTDPAGNIIGTDSAVTVNQPGVYTLRADLTSAGGCGMSETVEVFEDRTPPSATAVAAGSLTCVDAEVMLDASGSSSGPDFSYEWSTNDGRFTSATDIVQPVVDTTGTYTLVVTDNRNGCSASDQVVVVENRTPPVADAGRPELITCAVEEVTLGGPATSQGLDFIYLWTTSDGNISGSTDLAQSSANAPGTYSLLVRDARNGCEATDEVIIGADTQAPVSDAGDDQELICSLDRITLGGPATSSGPDFLYEWTSPDGNFVSSTNSLQAEVDAPGTYALRVTDSGNGCEAVSTVSVGEDRTAPVADAGLPATLTCTLAETLIGGTATSQGADFEYEWTTDEGRFVSEPSERRVTVGAPGIYRLLVRSVGNGCESRAEVTVTENKRLPAVDPGPDRMITCLEAAVRLDGGNSDVGPSFSYEWRTDTGNIVSGANSLTPVVDQPAAYELLIVDAGNGCRDSALVQVLEDRDLPVVRIEEPLPLNCGRSMVVIDASASDGGPEFSIAWIASQGAVIPPGEENSLTPEVMEPGRYELLIINEITGCRDSAFVIVRDSSNIMFADPGPVMTLTCAEPSVELDGSGSSAGPNIVYLWTTADGRIESDPREWAVRVNAPGNYLLTVRDTLTLCEASASVDVGMDDAPPVSEAGADLSYDCSVSELVLDGSASQASGGVIYSWSGPCIVSGANTVSPLINCPGVYYLSVEDAQNGCLAVDSVRVIENTAFPVAEAGTADALTCLVGSVVLNGAASSQGPDYRYSWSGPGIVEGENTLNPTVDVPGTYILEVADVTNNCKASSVVEVPEDRNPPLSDAGPEARIDCRNARVNIGGPETSSGPEFIYKWTTTNGVIEAPADQPTLNVSIPGVYFLEVTNTRNGCFSEDNVRVILDRETPVADAGPTLELNCAVDRLLLNGTNSTPGPGPEILYEWTGPCLTGDPLQPLVEADCPGIYKLTLTNTRNGCTSADSIRVIRDESGPNAVLADTAYIDCLSGTAVLDGRQSTGGVISWWKDGRQLPETGGLIRVSNAGIYQLVVNNTSLGCADTAAVNVLVECQPVAGIAAPDTITCFRELVTLDAGASSQGVQFTYRWTAGQPGCIVSGSDGLTPVVRCAGDYRLVVANTAVGFSDTAVVTVVSDTEAPVADAGTADSLTCSRTSVSLDAGGSSAGPLFSYAWTNPAGDTLSQTFTAATTSAGVHVFEVVNRQNGCRSNDFVQVFRDGAIPRITIPSTVFPCDQDTFRLSSLVEPSNVGYRYQWSGSGILADDNSSAVLINALGPYRLLVENPDNGCLAETSVTVVREACAPCVDLLSAPSLTCSVEAVRLTAELCGDCEGCTITWTTTPEGRILSDANTLTPLVGSAATYTLTVTDTIGFSTVVSVRVQEDLAPPPANAGADLFLTCANSEVVLGVPDTTTLFGYRWSREDGLPVQGDIRQSQLTVDAPGIYIVEAEDLRTGCFASDTVAVGEDYTVPLADAGSSRELTCSATLVTLDGSGSSIGDDFIYEWTAADGGPVAGGANTLNPVIDREGIYRIAVIDANNGCRATDSVRVTRSADLPPLPALSDQSLNCEATSVTLSGGAPDATVYTFQWCRLDASGAATDCRNEPEIVTDRPGRFRFEITDVRSGCVNSKEVRVTENFNVPQVEAGAGLTLRCGDEGGVLRGQAGPQGASLAFRWTSPDGHPVVDADQLSATVFMPGIYYLEVVDNDSRCSATDSLTVVRDAEAPSVMISPPAPLTCVRQSVTLAAQATTVSGNVSWQWQTKDGRIISNAATPMPQVGRPGIYEVLVTDPANACTSVGAVMVGADREAPRAAVDSSGGFVINCTDTSLELNASASLSVSGEPLLYSWRVVSGSPVTGDPSEARITVTSAGIYRLVVTEMRNGCRDTLDVGVQLDDRVSAAEIAASATSLTCDREEVQLSVVGFSDHPGVSYTWRDINGQALAQDQPTLSVTMPGTYRLFSENTGNGCIDSAGIDIVMDTLAPVIIIGVSEQSGCDMPAVTLNGSVASSGNDFLYFWQTSGGNIVSGQSSPQALVDAPGTYILMVTDQRNGCIGMEEREVGPFSTGIETVFFSVQPPGCESEGTGAIRVDSVEGGAGPFVYALDENPFSTGPFFDRLQPGTYRLRVQDSNGCEWEQEVEISGQVALEVDLGPDLLIALGDSVLLNATISGGAYERLTWSAVEDLNAQGKPQQVVAPLETTTYSVVVEGFGCRAYDNITVTVSKERPVFIPNAFSPDGDGVNDLFFVQSGPDVVRIPVLNIFDRWGQLVFQARDIMPNDPAFGWDGNLDGRPLNAAVFVYYAVVEFIDGEVEVVTGDVALVR